MFYSLFLKLFNKTLQNEYSLLSLLVITVVVTIKMKYVVGQRWFDWHKNNGLPRYWCWPTELSKHCNMVRFDHCFENTGGLCNHVRRIFMIKRSYISNQVTEHIVSLFKDMRRACCCLENPLHYLRVQVGRCNQTNIFR